MVTVSGAWPLYSGWILNSGRGLLSGNPVWIAGRGLLRPYSILSRQFGHFKTYSISNFPAKISSLNASLQTYQAIPGAPPITLRALPRSNSCLKIASNPSYSTIRRYPSRSGLGTNRARCQCDSFSGIAMACVRRCDRCHSDPSIRRLITASQCRNCFRAYS
jgi:hypothetical protein